MTDRSLPLLFFSLFHFFLETTESRSSSTLDIIIARGITTFIKLDGIYTLTGRKESVPSEFLGDGAKRWREDETREGKERVVVNS